MNREESKHFRNIGCKINDMMGDMKKIKTEPKNRQSDWEYEGY